MAEIVIEPKNDPSNESADYKAMKDDWEMIVDIRAGASAVKAKRDKYLPRYGKEEDQTYDQRLKAAPWRPEFVEALENICAKPFTKEVTFDGKPSSAIVDLAEDIDGEGNSLHVFAGTLFQDAVAMGLGLIYVTFPDVEPAPTLAEEKAAGNRPYWVNVGAEDVLALFTRRIGGRDVVTYIRIRENEVERDGFSEIMHEQIREVDLDDASGKPVWRVYRKVKDKTGMGKVEWEILREGVLTIPVIPVAPFFTGKRKGRYQVKPPMSDLAHMQMEIYRATSREDDMLTYAGAPMLVGKGMAPPAPEHKQIFTGDDQTRTIEVPAPTISIGPRVVLFAPPTLAGSQTDWAYIQPDAKNLKQVSDSVNNKIDHFRRLARQPLTRGSGKVTATATAVEAAMAHSAVKTWANRLADALEQAFAFTTMWLRSSEKVGVSVHTDFADDIEGSDEYANMIAMNEAGALSRDTLWREGQRRAIFGPDFDPEAEPAKIAKDPPPPSVAAAAKPGKPIPGES